MTILESNRDLYLAIGELSARHKSDALSLEHYLLAVLQLAEQHRNEQALTLSQFHLLLSDSFRKPPARFDEAWREDYDAFRTDGAGFEGWRATLIRQIVDLREMAENRALENEYRYFGIDSPRGNHWYNFDPATYIECAMAGSLGGWKPDDDTGRRFVPGESAAIDCKEAIHIANPQDVERPVVQMSLITWKLFKDFVECGQTYE